MLGAVEPHCSGEIKTGVQSYLGHKDSEMQSHELDIVGTISPQVSLTPELRDRGPDICNQGRGSC